MILDLFREGQRFATQPAQPLPQRVVEALDVGGAAADVVAGGKVATVGLSAVPPLSVLPRRQAQRHHAHHDDTTDPILPSHNRLSGIQHSRSSTADCDLLFAVVSSKSYARFKGRKGRMIYALTNVSSVSSGRARKRIGGPVKPKPRLTYTWVPPKS